MREAMKMAVRLCPRQTQYQKPHRASSLHTSKMFTWGLCMVNLLGWVGLNPLAINADERAENGFVLGLEVEQCFKGFADGVIGCARFAKAVVGLLCAVDGAD
jgi:hypothetical protein